MTTPADRVESAGAFAFGDALWPGVAKLAEECGEVLQVIGKLMMTHGDPAHWSGNLREQLLEEVADVEAAVVFFMRHSPTDTERRAMVRRIAEKVRKFEMWHADMAADPPPALEALGGGVEARNLKPGQMYRIEAWLDTGCPSWGIPESDIRAAIAALKEPT